MVRKHPGMSKNYASKMIRRHQRTRARAIHAAAKQLHQAMKQNALDPVTLNTFKWIRNRPTAAEREAILGIEQDALSPEIVARDYRSDKARVRRIGDKIKKLLDKFESV